MSSITISFKHYHKLIVFLFLEGKERYEMTFAYCKKITRVVTTHPYHC